jgi:uncharacterized membrane protein (DUF106 family)
VELLNLVNDFIVSLMDPVLGWLLRVPGSVALFIVAIGTSGILTFVRLFTTNQDLLRRCDHDKKRLKQLIREAKKAKDKEALARHRASFGQVSMKLMRAEGKPLLVSLLPIALLAVWVFARLAYVPPPADEPVTVKAYFETSAVDRLVTLLPPTNLQLADRGDTAGWVQRIHLDPDYVDTNVRNGLAVWRLKPETTPAAAVLTFHYDGKNYTKALEVGGRTYAPPLEFYNPGDPLVCGEVVTRELKLFGEFKRTETPVGRTAPKPPAWQLWPLRVPFLGEILPVPGVNLNFGGGYNFGEILPPWLTAYLLIAIPFVFLLKAVFHIH